MIDPVTMQVIGSVAAPIIGGLFGSSSNKSTNAASAAAAERANEFTREQMQNRHQWEVEDLRKAGLNPMLSAGAAPSMGGSAKAEVANKGEDIARGVSTAMAAKLISAQIDNVKSSTEQNKTQAALNSASVGRQLADREAALASAGASAQAARKLSFEADNEAVMRAPIAAQARNSAKEADTWTNKYIRPHTKAWADAVGDWTGAIGNVFRGSVSESTNTLIKRR